MEQAHMPTEQALQEMACGSIILGMQIHVKSMMQLKQQTQVHHG